MSTETLPIQVFSEKAYLDYSMYVILDRALPHIADGLKPVQRRIVYAMSELGLKATAKYKKSARTVGDVLGKFHPHGDTACYEAMVLMAQQFSYRHPLVDGQGNWGSSDDPKSFAAMRYTESKLSPYADSLLQEIPKGTVEWCPNFDGTLKEPRILPARLPNILLNSTTGIAVGMATDIPPHNLSEVVSACIHLLENPKATLPDLLEYIQAPDYPTGAELITPKNALQQMYETGTGSLRLRATYQKEDGMIVIDALPFRVSGSKVLEQIAQQMVAKKLPMVSDLRDESDHTAPIRLVIEPRSNRVNIDELMSHLFATTDLEQTYRVNFNMIGLDGNPQVKDLKTILKEWLSFRQDTVVKRLTFRLEQVLDRLHILEGLLTAYLNLDEVIEIIRTEDNPKKVLMKRFKLSETQAHAILEMKLKHLAKLEEVKLKSEQDELSKERDGLEKTLKSKARLKKLIIEELKEDAKTYGNARRTQWVERDAAAAIKTEDILPTENITVVLSKNGWIRSAKGHDVDATQLNYKAQDAFLSSVKTRSNRSVHVLDSTGRSYSIPTHTLPSARGAGEPLTSTLSPPNGARFVSLLPHEEDKAHILLASSAGYGFLAQADAFFCKHKKGKVILKLPENSHVLPPVCVAQPDSDYLAALTNQGRLLIFPVADLPTLERGKGQKIIQIPKASLSDGSEYCISVAVVGENDTLLCYAGKRHIRLKFKDLTHYQGQRGQRGRKLPRGFQQATRLEKTD